MDLCSCLKLVILALILQEFNVDAGNHYASTHGVKKRSRMLHDQLTVPAKRQKPSSKVHLSESEAHRIAAIYGGIGPVINPPGLQPMDKIKQNDTPEKSVSQRSKRSEDGQKSGEQSSTPNSPEQIHIAYGDNPSEMVIMWSTPNTGDSVVHYGKWPTALLNIERGSTTQFTDGNLKGLQWIHRAQLKNLTPGDRYFYRVSTGSEESEIFDFFTMKDGNDWPVTILAFGDMGRIGGAPSLKLLNRAAQQRSADAILHVGDIAYDLHGDGGKVGDDFMNRIQSIAAKMPYMTCPGNHEIPHNFSHYRYRFSMPSSSWPMTESKLWYSFNMGKVHFVSYSTEVYFTNGPIKEQLEWLERDLQIANSPQKRQDRPWIIAYGHRPMYCSNVHCNASNREILSGIEDLFYKYGVDLIIQGHVHSYERLWPVYKGKVNKFSYTDPQAPVHIISATAGCNAFDGVCVYPILEAKGPWSAYRSWIPGLYGIGKISVANSTHLHYEQKLALNGQTLDEFWMVQNNHGPFPDVEDSDTHPT